MAKDLKGDFVWRSNSRGDGRTGEDGVEWGLGKESAKWSVRGDLLLCWGRSELP